MSITHARPARRENTKGLDVAKSGILVTVYLFLNVLMWA
jgi:hypothetical protein